MRKYSKKKKDKKVAEQLNKLQITNQVLCYILKVMIIYGFKQDIIMHFPALNYSHC